MRAGLDAARACPTSAQGNACLRDLRFWTARPTPAPAPAASKGAAPRARRRGGFVRRSVEEAASREPRGDRAASRASCGRASARPGSLVTLQCVREACGVLGLPAHRRAPPVAWHCETSLRGEAPSARSRSDRPAPAAATLRVRTGWLPAGQRFVRTPAARRLRVSRETRSAPAAPSVAGGAFPSPLISPASLARSWQPQRLDSLEV